MLSISVDQLIQVASHGGGLELDAGQISKDDMLRILMAARPSNSRIVIKNSTRIQFSDLLQLASYGKGIVFFEG
jgi:hypothetical protein